MSTVGLGPSSEGRNHSFSYKSLLQRVQLFVGGGPSINGTTLLLSDVILKCIPFSIERKSLLNANSIEGMVYPNHLKDVFVLFPFIPLGFTVTDQEKIFFNLKMQRLAFGRWRPQVPLLGPAWTP